MKRILSLLMALVLLSSTLITICAATVVERDEPIVSPPTVSAYSAILIDMKTGESLFEYDADESNYPASTTKIMTAYLCLKYGDPDDKVTVSEDAFSDITSRASTWNLSVGETMTVHRLLQCLLVVSASEAANVVGEYISGSHEEFVNLMNEEAEELGCTNTHFDNCHGLPDSNHWTCARDLAKIAQAAMQYEEFREIVGSAVTVLDPTNVHDYSQSITSTNGILPGSSYPDYNYPYAIGIKTGHTNAAGYCLVSAADKDDTELLCVIMGCGSRVSSFSQTISLYNWGYENYDALTYNWDNKFVQTEDVKDEVTETADFEDVDTAVNTEDASLESSAVEADSAQETLAAATPAAAAEPTPTAAAEPTPAASAEAAVTTAPAEVSAASDTAEAVAASQQRSSFFQNLTWENLTGRYRYLLFYACGVLLLFVLLIVVIVIAVVHKHRRRKEEALLAEERRQLKAQKRAQRLAEQQAQQQTDDSQQD